MTDSGHMAYLTCDQQREVEQTVRNEIMYRARYTPNR